MGDGITIGGGGGWEMELQLGRGGGIDGEEQRVEECGRRKVWGWGMDKKG